MKKNSTPKVKKWIRSMLLAAVMILSGVGLTGCYVDGDIWNPAPPMGWNDTFYDSNLNGYWQLVEINNMRVTGYDVNYLFFNGYGRGRYYYFYRGARYWENTAYWCQYAVSGQSNYQINLQYESSGSPTTMNYWFEDRGRTLIMQWRNYDGWQTYVYVAYPGAPW
ncbi:MAG: hypothetical protein K2H35_05110 [Muribaculaceae bacterium]|nr:hypothetical protein [Muribaculaceae bacterium]